MLSNHLSVSDGRQVAQVQAQGQLTGVKSQFAADLLHILRGLTSVGLRHPICKVERITGPAS